MSRPSTAAQEWEVDGRPGRQVRLHRPGAGKRTAWRVSFYDADNKARERTAVGEIAARALGESIAAEQSSVFGDGNFAHQPVAALLDYYMGDYARGRQWSISYVEERERAVAWLPAWFLALACSAWRAHHSRRVLETLTEAGFTLGSQEYRRVGTVLSGLRSAAKTGGFSADGPDPLAGVPYTLRKRRDRSIGADGQLARHQYGNIEAVPAFAIPTWADTFALAQQAAVHTGRWWEELRILLLAQAGLRFGEAAALRCGEVHDFDSNYISVVRQAVEVSRKNAVGGLTLLVDELPKGGTIRTTFYSPDLVGMLRRRVAEVQAQCQPGVDWRDQLLLPTATGKVWRESNYLNKVWSPCARELGWQRVENLKANQRIGDKSSGWLWTPHSMRHLFATWLIRELGVPVANVSEYMGHADTRITEQLYVDRGRPNVSAAMRAFTEHSLTSRNVMAS